MHGGVMRGELQVMQEKGVKLFTEGPIHFSIWGIFFQNCLICQEQRLPIPCSGYTGLAAGVMEQGRRQAQRSQLSVPRFQSLTPPSKIIPVQFLQRTDLQSALGWEEVGKVEARHLGWRGGAAPVLLSLKFLSVGPSRCLLQQPVPSLRSLSAVPVPQANSPISPPRPCRLRHLSLR